MKKLAKAMSGKSMMKKGGKVTTKKMGMGGMHAMPDGTMMPDSAHNAKHGGAKKTKMMAGGAKLKYGAIPPARYGTTVRPMMLKGGTKKK